MTVLNTALAAALAGSARALRAPGCDPSNPTHAGTRMEGGKAVFENANYRITADDNNEVVIHNKNTGETYRAWGDPHFEVDGRHAFDFWGTTTFALDDGTKVTIETTPWARNPQMTLSSKVTITDGDYGVQISGVDSNVHGDLKIEEGRGWGQAVDWAVNDGNVLHENRHGRGFVAIDAFGQVRSVDQRYIDATDLKKGGALTAQFQQAFQLLGGLLSIGFVGGFIGSLGLLNLASEAARPRPDAAAPAPLPERAPTDFVLTLARWGGTA